MPAGAPPEVTLHATSVALGGRAALIRGPSNSGKSTLGLHLLALGACLVSDDRTLVRREGGTLVLDAPETIRGQIEARGVGILKAPAHGRATAFLVVDLVQETQPRLPPEEEAEILGLRLPLVRGMVAGHFAAAIHLYLKHGRAA